MLDWFGPRRLLSDDPKLSTLDTYKCIRERRCLSYIYPLNRILDPSAGERDYLHNFNSVELLD